MVALFLRPDADQSDGSWLNESLSNANLFSSVDETSFSDTDYIQSSTTDGDKIRLRLSDPGGGILGPLTVRYRCSRRAETTAANLIGRLYQGTSPGTLIATWTELAITASFATYTHTITSAEFANITDFTDLYVELELSAQPSLMVDLNLSAGTYYDFGTTPADATGNLSCSRASIGYAKNSDGTLTQFSSNALRIGVGMGLLLEDARSNICLQSEDFATTWAPDSCTVTTNQAVAPNGATTMDKLDDGTVASSRHIIYQLVAGITAGANCTLSIFAKDIDRRYVQVLADSGAGAIYCYADLQTGTITDSGVALAGVGTSFVSATIESYTSEIYRITLTGVSQSTVTSVYQIISLSDRATQAGGTTANNSPSYTGSNKTLYVWGAQVEQASFASSYVPTTTTATTRAADNITTTGSLQTVVNAATGSLVAQIDNGLVAGVAANIVDSNGTNLLGFDASNHALASMIGTLATGNTANRTTQDKSGLGWDPSGRSLVLNGGTVATDANAQTPSATQHIGSSGTANFAYAYIERLLAWTTKVADAILQGVTA